jgi:hypothetical protein
VTKLKQSWRAQRRTVFAVIGVLLLVWLVAAPIVQAQQRVRVVGGNLRNVARISNQLLDAQAIPAMGLFGAHGTTGNRGALSVRTFGGGGGFLGAGNCTPGTGPGNPLPNVVGVENSILTGIILTGNGTVTVTAAAVGGGNVPLANFEVNPQNPNVFVGLGNGLTVTSVVTFTGSGTDCNYVLIGQNT